MKHFAPPDTPEIAALKRAREIVSNGWCQGQANTPEGLSCLGHALNRGANWDIRLTHKIVLLVGRALPEEWRTFPYNIVAFNDADRTTKAIVMDVIDDAIIAATLETV